MIKKPPMAVFLFVFWVKCCEYINRGFFMSKFNDKTTIIEIDWESEDQNLAIQEHEEKVKSIITSSTTVTMEDNSVESMKDILLNMGVSERNIEYVFQRSKITREHISTIMQDFHILSAEKVAEALSIQSGFKYFSKNELDDLKINDMMLEIFKPKMEKYDHIVPIDINTISNEVTVLISDIKKISQASQLTDPYKVVIKVASPSTMQQVYRKFYLSAETKIDELIEQYLFIEQSKNRDLDTDAPSLIRDMIGNILRHASNNRVSDIYFHKTDGVGLVKYSVDGTAYIFKMLPFELYDRVLGKIITDARVKPEELINAMKDAAVEFSSEADRIEFSDVFDRYGFRLELGGSKTGITAVIRILDRQSDVAELKNLNFDKETYDHLQNFIAANAGLVLVTGPTGSGKTTSLYAMLKEIDPVVRSIQTIESPVEYKHPMWLQYEISRNTKSENEGAEWGLMLKGLLRNAPKVILMGEVRDEDTAKTLLDAANTGHLAFTTLHTNTAASAIARLKKLNVDMEVLGSILLGVLAQRLVRVLCPKCKEEDHSEHTKEMLKDLPSRFSGVITPYKPKNGGCPHCEYQGYKGRKMVYELLVNKPHVRKLVEKGEVGLTLAKNGIKEGFRMWDCGLVYLAEGITSAEEVMKHLQKEEFED